MMKLIALDRISLVAGRHTLLHPFSATFSSGERIAIIGPNGSGKSSLLKLIARLWRPTSGHIEVIVGNGVRGTDWSSVHGIKIGYVPQSLELWNHLTVIEHLLLVDGRNHFGRIRRRENPHAYDAASELLQKLGLGGLEEIRADRLSGGQRQRLALGRALVGAPDILLLDEFTSSLDPETANGILTVLTTNLISDMAIVLFVTHNIPFVQAFGQRLVFLDKGRLKAEVDLPVLAVQDIDDIRLREYLSSALEFTKPGGQRWRKQVSQDTV